MPERSDDATVEELREALGQAEEALTAAIPYINGVAKDASNSPWRITTAKQSLTQVQSARNRCKRVLADTAAAA